MWEGGKGGGTEWSPRNEKKLFFGSNRNKICFACVSVCFVKPEKKIFGLFRCFEPISKQPKQTELFQNEPKQSGMFWKIYHIQYLPRVLCLSYLSYIYQGSSVCHPVCHPVVLSYYSCRCCGTLSYSICFSNQTDQGDETEGFEREELEMERYEIGRLKREGVNRLFIV